MGLINFLLAFCTSKIFADENGFFIFLNANSGEKDRMFSTVRKYLYDIIARFMMKYPDQVYQYLTKIRVTRSLPASASFHLLF